MSMYPREIVEAIKDRSDIVDLIGTYVSLKRAGSNYNGLCPFHSEKTPSFTVFPDNQSFFCFGCEAGGDAFTFIMRTENLDYKGAIEFLAKRSGVDLPTDGREERRGVSRKRVFEMNLIAARFWRECLFDPNIGKVGMDYLTEKRGLPLSIIRRFGIGYAPNDFGALTAVLRKNGFTDEEMKALVARAIENAKYVESDDKAVIFSGSESYAELDLPEIEEKSTAELKQIALSLHKDIYAQSEYVSDGTSAFVMQNKTNIVLMNSHGLELCGKVGVAGAGASAVVSKDGEAQEAFSLRSGFAKEDLEAIPKDSVADALKKLGATEIESGKYDVILDGKQMRTLLSTFSSVFRAEVPISDFPCSRVRRASR